MKRPNELRHARTFGLWALLSLGLLSCKKEDKNPLLSCRQQQSGIGLANPRTIMFWAAQDFGCGGIQLIAIRKTETNSGTWEGPAMPLITKAFATEPACGTTGAITVRVEKGYEYEYTLQCSGGRQWKGKFTADCKDDCIVTQIK